MATNRSKEAGTPDKDGFVEEPDFGNAQEVEEAVEETHEEASNGRGPNDERIVQFLVDNPEFALKAQALGDEPENLKREILKQDIVMARQEESRFNGVWAKLCAEPKMFKYYNDLHKEIPEGQARRKAICEGYYESLRIEGNYVNPRFYDCTVTEDQVDEHIAKHPARMKELANLQSEAKLVTAYARNEYALTAGERRAKRKVDQFLESHEPDRNKIESMNDDALRESVIRDTYFKASRREAVNTVLAEWLDRSPGVKTKLAHEHAGKEPEHRRNSILKDASEAYRKATGKAPRGEKIEFDEESVKRHVEAHPDIYEPIRKMTRDELVAKDVQRRMNGSARAWQASPKIALYNNLLLQFNPDLHKRIISNARFQQEPFRTQKIARDVVTKGQELAATNPQVAQRARGMGR